VTAFVDSFYFMKTCIFSVPARAFVLFRVSALSLAVAAVFPSHAQSQLKETVVTANRSEQLLTEALPHTTVIGRDVIERSQAVDLSSLLSSEAGFQFTQNGGGGATAKPFF